MHVGYHRRFVDLQALCDPYLRKCAFLGAVRDFCTCYDRCAFFRSHRAPRKAIRRDVMPRTCVNVPPVCSSCPRLGAHMALMWQAAARLHLCHFPIRFRQCRLSQRIPPRSVGKTTFLQRDTIRESLLTLILFRRCLARARTKSCSVLPCHLLSDSNSRYSEYTFSIVPPVQRVLVNMFVAHRL